MIENKKVISRSLIVLFLCLSIVYSLAYQKKVSLFKAATYNERESTNHTWTNRHQESYTTDTLENNTNNTDSTNTNTTNSVSLWDFQPNWITNSSTQIPDVTQSSNSISLGSSNIKILPGTTEYFGTLDIISILDKKPEYTLQDTKWNYFAYYGNHLDFIQTVKTLGGNVYEMVTESEILQNQLFGDRVSYINLSMFKDVRVIMVIEIDKEVWLLQIPADKYHYSKDYLKSLFIH